MRAWKLILMCLVFTLAALFVNLKLFFDPGTFLKGLSPVASPQLSQHHQGEGACSNYTDLTLNSAALMALVDEMERSKLLDDAGEHVEVWLSWSLADERARHGPLTEAETRDLLCGSATTWQCFVATVNARALTEHITQLRGELPKVDVGPAVEPKLRELWTPRRAELASADNTIALLNVARERQTLRILEDAVARAAPEALDPIEDAWGTRIQIDRTANTVTARSGGPNAVVGGAAAHDDVVVSRVVRDAPSQDTE